MARRLWSEFPEALYHVSYRGNGGQWTVREAATAENGPWGPRRLLGDLRGKGAEDLGNRTATRVAYVDRRVLDSRWLQE